MLFQLLVILAKLFLGHITLPLAVEQIAEDPTLCVAFHDLHRALSIDAVSHLGWLAHEYQDTVLGYILDQAQDQAEQFQTLLGEVSRNLTEVPPVPTLVLPIIISE